MGTLSNPSVLYIVPSAASHRTAEENLGIGYIASFLRQHGYQVKIIDAWLEKLSDNKLFNKIDDYLKCNAKVLFVGISTYFSNIENVKKIVLYIKSSYNDTKIIAGGFGPTFFQKEFLDVGIDIVSEGEGEITNLQLCRYFENKIKLQEINNIAYYENDKIIHTKKGNLITNLDKLPFPARDTLKCVLDRKSSVNILSARGCMGHCSFCSIIEFQRKHNGKLWRCRSLKNFVDELEELYRNGVNFFKVIDDSFIEKPRNVEWCNQLADEIKKRNMKIRLRGSLIADYVSDEILVALKRAGFFSFACGIENFAPTALKRYEKRASLKVNCKALETFKRHDIYVQCGLILFDPYTTINELRINLKYLKKYNWVITKGIFTELYAASGTRFTNRLLLNDKNGELIRYNENYKYEITDLSVKKIYEALKKWHKNFEYLYDMIIDPLTSPKNISNSSMRELYNLYIQIHTNDLNIFEVLLENYRMPYEEINELIENEIRKIVQSYKLIEKKAIEVYDSEELLYDGLNNKYIT